MKTLAKFVITTLLFLAVSYPAWASSSCDGSQTIYAEYGFSYGITCSVVDLGPVGNFDGIAGKPGYAYLFQYQMTLLSADYFFKGLGSFWNFPNSYFLTASPQLWSLGTGVGDSVTFSVETVQPSDVPLFGFLSITTNIDYGPVPTVDGEHTVRTDATVIGPATGLTPEPPTLALLGLGLGSLLLLKRMLPGS